MKKQNYRPLFFTLLISCLALVFVIFINMNDAQRSVPKIKLSYFNNTHEVVSAITTRLQQEVLNQKNVWLGLEPQNQNIFLTAIQLKNELEKINGPFTKVYVDQELQLNESDLNSWGNSQVIMIKENWSELSNQIVELQKDPQQKILVITAAIYSTNLIQENPINKIKKTITGYNPLTFSFGYFTFDLDSEKENSFRCKTEDHSGVSPWGCAVVNKARSQHRKLDKKKIDSQPGLISGLMDLTGQNDYMVLVH